MRKVFMTQAGNRVYQVNGRADILMTTFAAELGGDPELFAARMVPDAPHLAKIERDISDHALPSSSRPDLCLLPDRLPSERSCSGLSEERSLWDQTKNRPPSVSGVQEERKRCNSGY